jgi:hypothetical protein
MKSGFYAQFTVADKKAYSYLLDVFCCSRRLGCPSRSRQHQRDGCGSEPCYGSRIPEKRESPHA